MLFCAAFQGIIPGSTRDLDGTPLLLSGAVKEINVNDRGVVVHHSRHLDTREEITGRAGRVTSCARLLCLCLKAECQILIRDALKNTFSFRGNNLKQLCVITIRPVMNIKSSLPNLHVPIIPGSH